MVKFRYKEFLVFLEEKFGITFNKSQQEFVTTIGGPILVCACPGSGKTWSLNARLFNMVYNYGIHPNRILTVTFSNASAIDMKTKFSRTFGEYVNETMNFSTIHSLAYKIVRDWSVFNNINYKIIEGEKFKPNKKDILQKIYLEVNKEQITEDDYENLTRYISFVKNALIKQSDIYDLDIEIANFVDIFNRYEFIKNENNYLDFDDMLVKCYEILKEDSMFREKYQNMFDYLNIDEAQDTSTIQFRIAEILVEKHRNICVIGDDDQTIYSWRSADVDNFLNFDRKFPEVKIINFDQNYRSCKAIIEPSDKVIKNNVKRFEKDLFTDNHQGEDIKINIVNNYQEQIDYIIKDIKLNNKINDTAILYRNNITAFELCDALERNNIKFYLRDYKNTLFGHWILQDILSFFRLALFPSDIESLEKIYYKMERFISKSMIDHIKTSSEFTLNQNVFDKLFIYPKLKSFQRDQITILKQEFERLINKNPLQAINYIENEFKYYKYLEKRAEKTGANIERFKRLLDIIKSIASNCKTLYDFEDRIYELQEIMDESKNNKVDTDTITLTTVHSSKGLEWENVYMIDLMDQTFPSSQAIKSMEEIKEMFMNKNIEEYSFLIDDNKYEYMVDGKIYCPLMEDERKLYYVGMTRAKEHLHLIYPKFKNGQQQNPSRFLIETAKGMGESGVHILELLENNKKYSSETKSKKNEYIKIGDFVKHFSFGVGKIESISNGIVKIKFDSGLKLIKETLFENKEKIVKV